MDLTSGYAELVLILTVSLCLVKSSVSFLKQLFIGRAVLAEHGNTYTGGQTSGESVVDTVFLERRGKPLEFVADKGYRLDILDKNDKFIAADTSQDIRLTEVPAELIREGQKNLVTYGMAACVVYGLEVVYVYDDERVLSRGALLEALLDKASRCHLVVELG